MFIALAYKSVTLIIFLITDESCRLDKVTCISEVRITYLIKFDCVSMCMQAYVRISIEYTYYRCTGMGFYNIPITNIRICYKNY